MPSTPAALLEPLRLPEASDPEDFDPEDFSPGSAEEALLRPHPPGSVGHRPPPLCSPRFRLCPRPSDGRCAAEADCGRFGAGCWLVHLVSVRSPLGRWKWPPSPNLAGGLDPSCRRLRDDESFQEAFGASQPGGCPGSGRSPEEAGPRVGERSWELDLRSVKQPVSPTFPGPCPDAEDVGHSGCGGGRKGFAEMAQALPPRGGPRLDLGLLAHGSAPHFLRAEPAAAESHLLPELRCFGLCPWGWCPGRMWESLGTSERPPPTTPREHVLESLQG